MKYNSSRGHEVSEGTREPTRATVGRFAMSGPDDKAKRPLHTPTLRCWGTRLGHLGPGHGYSRSKVKEQEPQSIADGYASLLVHTDKKGLDEVGTGSPGRNKIASGGGGGVRPIF